MGQFGNMDCKGVLYTLEQAVGGELGRCRPNGAEEQAVTLFLFHSKLWKQVNIIRKPLWDADRAIRIG